MLVTYLKEVQKPFPLNMKDKWAKHAALCIIVPNSAYLQSKGKGIQTKQRVEVIKNPDAKTVDSTTKILTDKANHSRTPT